MMRVMGSPPEASQTHYAPEFHLGTMRGNGPRFAFHTFRTPCSAMFSQLESKQNVHELGIAP